MDLWRPVYRHVNASFSFRKVATIPNSQKFYTKQTAREDYRLTKQALFLATKKDHKNV